MYRFRLPAIFLALTLATPVAAEPAGPQRAVITLCPIAGTVVVTNRQDVRAYLGMAPDDSELCRQTHNNRPMDLLFNMETVMSPNEQRAILRQLFPLRVGAKASGDVPMPGMGGRLAMQNVVEVLREEEITIPAGTFDTWVVQSTPSIRNGQLVRHATRLVWFDKQTGVALRAQTLENVGFGDIPPNWEAVRVTSP